MDEKIKKLRRYFAELFNDEIFKKSHIEISDFDNELIFSATQEGFLHLIWLLMELIEQNNEGSHFHVDEWSNTVKCEKAMQFAIINKL